MKWWLWLFWEGEDINDTHHFKLCHDLLTAHLVIVPVVFLLSSLAKIIWNVQDHSYMHVHTCTCTYVHSLFHPYELRLLTWTDSKH